MKTINLIRRSFFALVAMGAIFSGCSDDDGGDVVTPTPTVDFTFSPATPVVGQEVTFTTTSENATSYVWTFGNGQTSTEKNPKTTYTSANSFNVTVIATGDGGTANASKTVVVTVPEPVAEPIEIYFLDNTPDGDDVSENDVFTLKKLSNLGIEPTISTVFNTEGFTVSLAFNAATNTVYYSDDDNRTIVKVNLDGTGSTVIVEDLVRPRGLALNQDGTKLFVTDRGSDEIYSINLSTNEKTLIVSAEDLTAVTETEIIFPEAIAFYNGKIYFNTVEELAEGVWSANEDGSGLTRLLDYDDAGYGYSIAVDVTNSKLYFDNADGSQILSSSFTGASVTEIAPNVADDRTFGLAIDPVDSKIYWSTFNTSTEEGFLKRANLDGTNIETLSENLGTIRGIFLKRTN